MSSWQFCRMWLAVVRIHLFLLAVVRLKKKFDVKEQHTYSAAIETLLVCKHWIIDLNVYLVKQLYGNLQITDNVYDIHA